MFKFLKKDKFSDQEIFLLKAIVYMLPEKYSYLREQVSREFILGKSRNVISGDCSYTLKLNANMEGDFINKSLPHFFIIKNISIYNKINKKFELIELDIMQGILAGFKLPEKAGSYDINKIDVSEIKEKHFEYTDKKQLLSILGNIDKKVINRLEIDETFSIEIDGKFFYTIKNIGDGNYISIDKDGAVYAMQHDPFSCQKIYSDIRCFENDVLNDRCSYL